MRTYSYKLYRADKNKHLHKQIDIACSIYNHCIALHKRYYKIFGKSISKFTLTKHLAKLKKQQRYNHWKTVGSQAVQDIVFRIDKGYKAFFKKDHTRPPSFKKRRNYKSFTLTHQAGWAFVSDKQIRINKHIFKFSKSRDIEGVIKTITIKRDRLGDLYLFFACEVENKPIHTVTGKNAGMDFGLKTFLTASDGTEIQSPLFFKQSISQLKKANKSLSKKVKGSNHRKMARIHLARQHKKIANQRKDFHFQLAKRLIDQYDNIFLEDLNLKGMQALWGRKISDLGFSDFVKILEHMADKYGVTVHKIDRWYPSSKTCSECNNTNDNLHLSDRSWTCHKCGISHNRDLNAAINILREGASSLGLGDIRPSSMAIPA